MEQPLQPVQPTQPAPQEQAPQRPETWSDIVRKSVRSVKEKLAPQSNPTPRISSSTEGEIMTLHTVYSFLGEDFAGRNTRAGNDVYKKVREIIDFANENGDGDIVSTLARLQQEIGAKPNDVSSLDHLYHAIKFRDQAFETMPVEKRVESHAFNIKQAEAALEEAKAEMRKALDEKRAAAEYTKLIEKAQRWEERAKREREKIAKILKNDEEKIKQYLNG